MPTHCNRRIVEFGVIRDKKATKKLPAINGKRWRLLCDSASVWPEGKRSYSSLFRTYFLPPHRFKFDPPSPSYYAHYVFTGTMCMCGIKSTGGNDLSLNTRKFISTTHIASNTAIRMRFITTHIFPLAIFRPFVYSSRTVFTGIVSYNCRYIHILTPAVVHWAGIDM